MRLYHVEARKGNKMNIVEYALDQIRDETLPVKRNINCYEINVIRETAKKLAEKMPGGLEDNLVIMAIGAAYDYGFWQGWNHCEAERPELYDFDVDEASDGFGTDEFKEEVTA